MSQKFCAPILIVACLIMVACVAGAVLISRAVSKPVSTQSLSQTLMTPTSRNLSLQPEAARVNRRLGNRFNSSAKTDTPVTGILRIGASQYSVTTIRHLDQSRELVDLLLPEKQLSWDETDGVKATASVLTRAERLLAERLILDTADHFVLAQLRGASYLTVARNLRPDDAGDDYKGPLWTVVRLSETQRSDDKGPLSAWRLYYINAATELIDRIVCELDGRRIETTIQWAEQNGEQVPTGLKWTMQGETSKEFVMPGIRSTLPPAFLLSLISLTCMAQEASRPARGVMPNGSSSVSDIENISLQNGNVNINIPLASLPPIAGGKLSWTISANYNSKLWNVTRYQQNDDPLTWAPYTIDTPGVDGGWTIGGTYSFTFRNVNEDLARIFYNGNSGLPQYELDWINNTQWWKVVLRMPDGSEHEFRPVDCGGSPGTAADFLHGFFDSKPNGTAKRYYSVDGAFMFARITNINDWIVYMLDGTQIIQTTDGVQRVQDTNGNKIKIFSDSYGTHYQDEQTSRELRLVYNPAGQGQYQVWYNTVGGVAQHIDINLGTTTVQGKLYAVNNPPCDFKNEVLSAAFQVVREIVFPQTEPAQPQRRFTFSYNSDTSSVVTDVAQWSCPDPATNYTRTVSYGLGELSKIVTPSGSEVTYTYSHDGVSSFSEFVSADTITQDTVVEKRINHDGTFDKWTYAIAQSVGSGSVTGPDDAVSSEFAYNSILNNPGYSTDKLGLVYRSIRPFTKTERHWIKPTFSGADITAQNGNTITLNPVVDKEYTTLTDASGANLKMSARVFSYDYNGNLVQETHYDWFDPALVSRDVAGVPTGVPASATVLKVITNSHYNQASSSTSANVYAKRSIPPGTPLILNAPRTTAVGSSSVRFSYDGQAFDVAPTVGNLTAKSVWVDLESKWITTSNTYDTYGNVATSTDARGKITQFAYGDNSHALPTSVTVDPQNGSGTQTTTTAYDFSTGLVTSQTDANGQQTTIDYTNQLLGTVDPFGRPGITKAPAISIGGNSHRRRVTTKYFDSARQVIVASDLNAENHQLLKSRTTVDQLGRPTLTESTEDGTNYTISVRSAYLNMGQVTLTSSPMRSAAAATDSWARATKDKAGRVTELATFGGAAQPAWTGTAGTLTGAVTTAYSANFTTVTDQAGKVRRSMSDALGRLVRVDEPDASGNLGSTTSPNQPTSYGYSVLDNLTTVTQGSQIRTFTYDSLSRLRTGINPESGTISYQYDDNGNLIVKTEPRGVSTHYEYDALNRVKRRWYNGSRLTSEITHNNPALPPGVGVTEEVKFYYDTQPAIGGPSYTTGPLKGRLVAQTYGSGTTGDYYGYDVLVRPKVKIQRTGAKDYDMTAEYTLSGAVSSLAYPSGHTINNTYDQVGRLTGLSGTLGDGTTRTYATNINYSSLGGMLKEQFGTNTPVYHKLHYNSRAQICDIRASNVNDDWGGELGALVNYYRTPYAVCGNGPDNNGNLLMSQTIINSFYIEGRYTYDSLNRLKSVGEFQNGVTNTGNQTYDYDRWGNRISLTASGTGINDTSFEIESATNRIYAPGDLALSPTSRRIQYDTAGNQKQDTYTGAGTRTYDAENKLTSAAANNNQTATYVYDASGQRIKRTANGVETWQVYGFGGELLAEYPANGDKLSPQKEYGYRNGELLVTAEAGVSTRTNVALAANGGVASASSTYACCGCNFAPEAGHNGNPSGVGWGSDEGWNDNPPANTFPDWLQIDFNGSKTIDEIDVFTGQDNWQYPSEPTEAMTFSLYGLTGFDVQYWNGSSWTTVSGGSVSGNNKVRRKFTFTPVTTTKIRVLTNASIDGYSRITEVEAWATQRVVARQFSGSSQTTSAPHA